MRMDFPDIDKKELYFTGYMFYWFICLVFDYFNHRKRKKEINNIETKNLNLLKEYNHDEWVKVMRTKKLSRVLETIR